ncbi:MAG: phosphatase [Clostridia bacterium]|nr:phosphatase [Clostridia bacterium]
MNILIDTHCHTIASGHGYSTIQEIAYEASKKGLKMVCITEHGPALPGGPHEFFFGNIRVVPEEIYGVRILKGVEANIIDSKGNLDVDEKYLKNLDIVVASMHSPVLKSSGREEDTDAVVNAIKNPYVDIIGHPGNPYYDIDYKKMVLTAAKYNKLIEINNSSFFTRKGSDENCRTIAKLAIEAGANFAIGSDSHISFDVGNFEDSLSLLEEIGCTEEPVMNISVEKFIGYLNKRGRDIEI